MAIKQDAHVSQKKTRFSASTLPKESGIGRQSSNHLWGCSNLTPPEVVAFYRSLTDDDRVIIMDLASRLAHFKSEEDVVQALKEKSMSLFNRAKTMYDILKSRVDSLNPEAKAFMERIFLTVRGLRSASGTFPDIRLAKKHVRVITEDFWSLSLAAKAELQEHLPIVVSFLNGRSLVITKSEWCNCSETVDSLNPEAKAFMECIFLTVRGLRSASETFPDIKLVKKHVRVITEDFWSLSLAAKAELQERFPIVVSFLNVKREQILANSPDLFKRTPKKKQPNMKA
uniref:Fatty-acid and retinol-binding protein 1 n=1 Tax=Steinernema glaseri TaxID=37863 RepID=A0A1I7ZV50_9BILA